MKIEIKHRYTDNVLFACEAENMREAVLAAIKISADLRYANLSSANLSSANLRYANLSYANLSSADLSYANLSYANLSSADLRYANLRSADLRYADLSSAKNLPTIALAQNIIVSQGDIIGWKALRDGKIAQLLIPSSAKRINSIGSRKCRAEYATVTAIFKGKKKVEEGVDKHTGQLIYKVGETVTPNKFDDSIYVECSSGIHFFITREEAEDYDK